jgi:hypothetical protein
MHPVQAAGLPPKRGSIIRANIGRNPINSAELSIAVIENKTTIDASRAREAVRLRDAAAAPAAAIRESIESWLTSNLSASQEGG